MAFPYALWSSPQHYAIPAIPPSSHPMVQNPEGAIRDFVEHSTNGDRTNLCDTNQLKWFEEWGKQEEYRKVIMDVLKSRLDLGWPYNYKALDILAVMPISEAKGVVDKLTKLNESTGEGSAEVKKILKPLMEKVKAEIAKGEEEEAKARQAAILGMWGGMWANDGFNHPQLASAGWGGFPYPYAAAGIPPGVPALNMPMSMGMPGMGAGAGAAQPYSWNSHAPEGWPPSSITPLPQVYPFSRTGYYGWLPDPTPPEVPPPQAQPGWWVGVSLAPPT